MIICGEDNVALFRTEFKNKVPEFYNFAKELYSSGLISGLRGASIELIADVTHQQIENEPPAQNFTPCCEQCGKWQRDQVGDGTGIGICLLNIKPSLLKWPKTPACNSFLAMPINS